MSKKNVVASQPTPQPIAAPKAKVRKTVEPAPQVKKNIVASAAKAAAKTPTPKPEVKADAAPKSKTPSKYISRDLFLGRRMRVAEYQDYTFSINGNKDRMLTDEELCADWQKQFPSAVHFETFHVRGARRDFNAGLHSKAFTGKHDSKPVFLVNGKRTIGEYARTVKAEAKVEAKAEMKKAS